ncbi:hypothetical protein [Gymnodinialimonas hymeniacidonis]|uniref:hypothetical protein n=1 Tax=Gymnodinialimonas hymeniacidonis TaxID=3126508 RepID=UPI0034C6DAB6
MIGQYRDREYEAADEARLIDFYSEAQLQDITTEFDVPVELTEQFARELQIAGQRWHEWRARDQSQVSSIRQALARIGADLSATSEKLKSLPEEVWRSLGEAPQWFDEGPNKYEVRGELLDDWSLYEIRLSVETGPSFQPHSASISEIVAILDALAERAYIVELLEGQFRGKPGPKRDLAFNEWVRSIASMWCSTLRRDFTYDAKAGGAISDAARFCVAAFRPLDPDQTERETINKLRSFLEFHRKAKNLQN